MKIFFLYSGPFGEQIINTISLGGLGDQITGAYELRPENIPGICECGHEKSTSYFENPEQFVPDDLPHDSADLLVVLGVHGCLSDLIPPIAKRLGARSVLYPIDDRDMIPDAKKTIQDELQEEGIFIEFPEPFCSLTGSNDPLIDSFSKIFGRPALRIESDPRTGIITDVDVLRDTPCGSASCIGGKLIGVDICKRNDLSRFCYDEQHNDEAEHYCLAEMDPRYPIMQEAGDLLKDAVFEACGIPTTKTTILSVLKKRGQISIDELARSIIGSPGDEEIYGCVTRRAFERYLDELIAEGHIRRTPDNTLTS
jgi:thymidylate synthase